MAWLKSLFGRGGADETAEREVECSHMNLTARWDDPADVGNEQKAVGYNCIACSESFTIEQAEAMGRTPAA